MPERGPIDNLWYSLHYQRDATSWLRDTRPGPAHLSGMARRSTNSHQLRIKALPFVARLLREPPFSTADERAMKEAAVVMQTHEAMEVVDRILSVHISAAQLKLARR